MSLFYPNFARKYSVRRPSQLTTPPMPAMAYLELPKLSMLHHVGAIDETTPDPKDYLFRLIRRPILVHHVTQLTSTRGNPRRHSVNILGEIRHFHTHNRRFQNVADFSKYENMQQTLAVVNYGFLFELYSYQKNAYNAYWGWYNVEKTAWDTIAELASTSIREQFIRVKLPQILPAQTDLRVAEKGITQQTLHHLNGQEAYFILELWKWCGPNRESSILSVLPKARLARINLLFEESGRWLMINLGVLDSWRLVDAPDAEEEEGKKEPVKLAGYNPLQLQKRVLRMLMALFEVRSVGDGAVPGDGKNASGDLVQKTTESPSLPHVNESKTAVVKEAKTTFIAQEEDVLNPSSVEDESMDFHLSAEVERHIDADLQALEHISTSFRERQAQLLKEVQDQHAAFEKTEAASVGITSSFTRAIAPNALKDLKPIQPLAVEQTAVTEEYALGVQKVCDRLAAQGILSAAEHRRYLALATRYTTIEMGNGETLKTFAQIKPEFIKITDAPVLPDIATVVDKSMLKSSLIDFDQRYIRDVLKKDVSAMVLNIQHAGICITDFEVDHQEELMGSYDAYTIRVVPVDGAASTLRFKLPTIKDDGTYEANGVKYRLRKQRGDLPIRKIEPGRVALTSYYGKVFIDRNEKKVNNYDAWLCNQIMVMGLSESTTVTELHPGNVFDNLFTAPKLYTALAQQFRSFTVMPRAYPKSVGSVSIAMNFDHTQRKSLYGEEALKAYEKEGKILCGKAPNGALFLITPKGEIEATTQESGVVHYGSIEAILGLDAEKAPVPFVEVKILGRSIPMGVVLAYVMGLDKLIALLGVEYRRVPKGKRAQLAVNEYSLVFGDETLVFNREDALASLILAGFNEYHRAIKEHSVYEFDRPGVYLNVLEFQAASAKYVREIDLLNQLFIDPITKELLVEMKEPTDFLHLLLRGAELLLTDGHPHVLDPTHMRIKGYERMAGAVYAELVRSIRAHNGRPGKSRQPLDLHPYAVWKAIAEDPSKAQVSDINPIQNLKETEAVTYSGVGGRNSRSMTKSTRAYHPNDMGTISESTVDSSDVAINTYTSADPLFTSLRGVSSRYEIGKSGATSLLSTSALISVAADRDDPKRVNFIGIQHGHGIACEGYHASPVRTGYEQVIAHRTNDLFAFTAKKPGVVVSVSELGMQIKYDDGETQGIELGRRYGNAAGLTIPHQVVPDVREGQKFKAGTLLCHNTGFFERDLLNPNQVVWKAGVTVKTALLEAAVTLEDSSAITHRTAELLKTQITKTRIIIVDFKQSIRKLVKVGDFLESEAILCVIEDPVTANNELFDESSLDTLRILSAQTPQAKTKGQVERIEVYYHGEKEDMSESLRALANAADRELAKRHLAVGKKAMSGQAGDSFRSDGEPLALDTAAIKLYLTADVSANVGDKGVFGNQMKTVFGEVIEEPYLTESGKEVDAIFGATSISARIVTSPDVIGTTTSLLIHLGKMAVDAYRKG